MTCRRNAFVVLCNIDQELAVQYLLQVIDSVPTFDELLQLAVIELIRTNSKTSAANKVTRKKKGNSNLFKPFFRLIIFVVCLNF